MLHKHVDLMVLLMFLADLVIFLLFGNIISLAKENNDLPM